MSEPMHLAERAAARLRAGGVPGMGGLLGGPPHAPDALPGAASPGLTPQGLAPLGLAPQGRAPHAPSDVTPFPLPPATPQARADVLPGALPGTAPADPPAPPVAEPPPAAAASPGPAGLLPGTLPGPLPAPPPAEGEGRGRRTLSTAALLRAGMIEWGRKRSRISEEFRIIQGQLLRTQLGLAETGMAGANLVLVTSARPEEGKSFTALNLACAVARYGEVPVLLLDADAKHNSVSMLLGLSEERGLLDLAGDPGLEVGPMVMRTEVPFFSVLPIGGAGAQKEQLSAVLPLANTVTRIGREMARHVVVLDAPPCMVSSDPSTLAPVVGQVVMLIEAQRTQRGELDAALEMVAGCDTVSLVLNKVRSRAGDTFGADGYYGAYYKS